MITPVRAAILTPPWAQRVISPPHDTLTAPMREHLMAQNPDSFLHVTGAPVVSETHPSGHQSTAVRAAAALKRLRDEGAYTEQAEPMFFVQRIEALGRVQNSLIGAISFDEHELLPHEATHDARVYGLAASFSEMAEMWSPVVVACPPVYGIKSAINAVQQNSENLLHIETADGATITIWGVDPADTGARSEIKVMNRTMRHGGPFYIIDGHHRVAAARMAGFKQVLVALVPPDDLILTGFDRLISDIDVMPRRVLDTLSQHCEVTEVADENAAIPTSQGWLGVGMDGHWYSARWLDLAEGDKQSAGAALPTPDSAFIHAQLLPALFGITESSDPRISYRPSRLATDPAAAQPAADPAPATDADHAANPAPADPAADVFTILTAPVPVETVFVTAGRGETMPPKSTYLVPKVRTGVMLVAC